MHVYMCVHRGGGYAGNINTLILIVIVNLGNHNVMYYNIDTSPP